MTAFAEISGDYHPLHTDKNFAMEKGFRDQVVYGNVLGFSISALVGESLPTKSVMLIGQKIDYRKPMFVGDRINLEAKVNHVSEATGMVELKLSFRRDDELVASGSCSFKCLED